MMMPSGSEVSVAAEVLKDTLAILGLAKTDASVSTLLDLLPLIREGLPTKSLESVAKVMEMSTLSTVEHLGLAKRTYARRVQAGKPLTSEESERIFRLARVFAQATCTLGERDKARRWLLKPNRALGGAVPVTLLDTDIGAGAVFDELGRIAHGVFA
jgi:putative toxin-antitoxin system antitoxin component (TIGR02293 family)